MAKRKTRKGGQAAKGRAKRPLTPAQEALQITWVLKGNLKNAQVAYLRVGKLLVEVRDRQLFAELGHPDLADYAERRLGLGQTSLYRYLNVYDWTKQFHPEWLEPKPKGFIPDLSDVSDLMWIEEELKRKGLRADKRTALEELRKKGLEGKLRQKDLAELRKKARTEETALKSFLARLRTLRRRGVELAQMPEEAIAHLDAAIEILRNAVVVRRAA